MFKKIFSGKVTSTKNQKTLVVLVSSLKTHKLYSKKFVSCKKYHVHYEEGSFKIGDTVNFVHSKTHSRLKKWEVIDKQSIENLKKSMALDSVQKNVVKKSKIASSKSSKKSDSEGGEL